LNNYLINDKLIEVEENNVLNSDDCQFLKTFKKKFFLSSKNPLFILLKKRKRKN
jgi:hypothetical protein